MLCFTNRRFVCCEQSRVCPWGPTLLEYTFPGGKKKNQCSTRLTAAVTAAPVAGDAGHVCGETAGGRSLVHARLDPRGPSCASSHPPATSCPLLRTQLRLLYQAVCFGGKE
ncbi:hypothetical protein GN956_G11160 [Arapaima gigas]